MSHFKNVSNICQYCGIVFQRKRFPSGRYEQVSQFLNRRFCSILCSAKGTGQERAIPFWDRVDKTGGNDACWPWKGAINRNGYGSFGDEKIIRTALRVAYELINGPIPIGPGYHGFVVMHSCDNRRCCNPRHLSLGTQTDNNIDRDRKGRLFENGISKSKIGKIAKGI